MFACGGTSQGNNTTNTIANAGNVSRQVRANDNAEELGMVIRLPFEPEEAVWIEEPVTGSGSEAGSARRLKAVLLFLPNDAEKLIAEAKKQSQPESVEVRVDEWFPSELISKSEMSENQRLRGLRMSAEQFFQTPFNSGTLIDIDGTDYFVLELSTNLLGQ